MLLQFQLLIEHMGFVVENLSVLFWNLKLKRNNVFSTDLKKLEQCKEGCAVREVSIRAIILNFMAGHLKFSFQLS
jgi:hypothetical protein